MTGPKEREKKTASYQPFLDWTNVCSESSSRAPWKLSQLPYSWSWSHACVGDQYLSPKNRTGASESSRRISAWEISRNQFWITAHVSLGMQNESSFKSLGGIYLGSYLQVQPYHIAKVDIVALQAHRKARGGIGRRPRLGR